MIDEFNGSGFAATDLRGRAPAFSLIARLRQEMSGTGGNPQAGIPSHARSWFVGILGELEIAGLLDALPSGWLVLHSVPLGESGTDIDHVVVSPRGVVMTINTKRHAGKRIWVGEHAL
ncbi:nuclease-related domain-containing protein [Curtobacterium sp. MCPF17_003]|uniref:nuclease-related domain-containing protein n=1 Tax=Curtobacterium sp. MCPF17_003 TaxID=2175637 RepID=UPI0015E8AD2A|nr:nuclease-related domain-containing protein [Curtobacterium sp. MCPF17_003]